MIDITRLGFDFLVPFAVFVALAIAVFGVWICYLWFRGRAWLTRGIALSVLLLALSNPALIQEEREPLPSVAALVLDQSESMSFGSRSEDAEAALEALEAQLREDPSLDVRVVRTNRREDGTSMVSALEGLMADVPRDRVAGAIMITDGQVHDVPGSLDRLGDLGPIHSLIVGDERRGDRRVEIVDSPEFGIVGESAEIIVRVDDPRASAVQLSVAINGGEPRLLIAEPGRDTPVRIEVPRRGENIVVVEVPEGNEELTLANNRTAMRFSGVPDRLQVLLITGRPNASGRVWRDLLKSDPSVDLVHFTILRPNTKPRRVPENELALIPFPYEELFEEKLDDFDLIIFDQYQRLGIITLGYLQRIVRYVEDGGALLITAGTPFAGPASLALTPLASVLPATPTGDIKTGEFTPELTEEGRRHTVTSPLTGSRLGAWLRYIEAEAITGDVLMKAPDDAPLLVVDRVDEGRVGQLLTDQIWLWARGYDGGGPFSELSRRLVHWMLKEPELEERQLELNMEGDVAKAQLRTLSDDPAPLTLEGPNGELVPLGWTEAAPGLYEAETPTDSLGLYRATAGPLEAVALNGPANPKEYVDLRSVTDVLDPVGDATDGLVARIGANAANLPDIRRVRRNGRTSGNNWMGLKERDAYLVRDSRSQPLLPGILIVSLILLALGWAWWREGR